MAGLSHALAESEFHLSVLRGSVLMLPLLLWPIHQLAGLVITMASWISHWPAGKRWPAALRLPSKAKLPSPSARCFGAMAYRCSASSIALEHW